MTATWADQPILAIDTETTGVDPFTDRIVEVAAVRILPDGTVTDQWHTIVDPGVEIPDGAAQVHRITTDRARAEGVTPTEALAVLAAQIFAHGHQPLVMFNARFDWPLLLAEADRHSVEFPVFAPILDPYLLDRMCDRYRKGKRQLTLVADHYGVPLSADDAHGALADATAAGLVLRQILARYPEITSHPLAGVYLRQVHGAETDRRRFEDYMRTRVDPTFTSTPGWPIPVAKPAVTSPPAETRTEPPVPAPAPAAPPAADPAPAGPAPAPAVTITVQELARYATTVLHQVGAAAPHRMKTRWIEAARHAITHAVTGVESLNDLDPAGRSRLYSTLRHIASGDYQLHVHTGDDPAVELEFNGRVRRFPLPAKPTRKDAA